MFLHLGLLCSTGLTGSQSKAIEIFTQMQQGMMECAEEALKGVSGQAATDAGGV